MFFFGHHRSPRFTTRSAFQLGLLFLLLTGALSSVFGQTAPYVLPYTSSTYAGPNAAYSGVGVACGSYFTLDKTGDGCLVNSISVGTDPHDLRIGAFGDLFFIDNVSSSTGIVHRISPFSNMMTIEAGNDVGWKPCNSALDAYGDGCIATDGAANANLISGSTSHNNYTALFKANRGIGTGPNGDFYIAGYNNDLDHRIGTISVSGATQFGYMETVAGTSGTAGAAPTTNTGVPVSGSHVNQTRGISGDGNGNAYIADTVNYVVREESNGIITNLTSGNSGSGTFVTPAQNNVPALTDNIGEPEDVQLDSFGNVYIVDFSNNVVIAIYKAGTLPGISNPVVGNVYVIAGKGGTLAAGTYSYPTDGTTPTVAATSVQIGVRKISLDSRGNIYIPDYSQSVVWFIDHATGYMRLIAGHYNGLITSEIVSNCSATTDGIGDGCPATQASFYFTNTNSGNGGSPDNLGNYFVTEPADSVATASRIRELTSGLNFPAVTVATGSGTPASATQNIDVHFAPSDSYKAATLPTSDFSLATSTPTCTTNADNTQDCIFSVTFAPTVAGIDKATLKVTSTAGGVADFTLTGTGTAPAIAFDPGNTTFIASISGSQGIAIDGAGNAYIADTGSNTVLRYNAATATTTVFAGGGSATCSGATDKYGDGCAATASALNAPKAVALDSFGNLYIADTGNNIVRMVAPNGTIQLVAGGGTVCAAVGQYTAGAADAVGDGCLGTQATLSSPSGLAVDSIGNLYIADTGNNLIREVNKYGYIVSFAGGGTACTTTAVDSNGDGCAASSTTFNAPTGLVYDPVGKNILVADTGNSIIRKIYLDTTFTNNNISPNTAGVASNIQVNPVTLIAGNGQAGSSIDVNSAATLSELSHPTGVAIDASGTVYIADSGNSAIRMVTPNGIISTIAGILGASGTGTVPASAIVTQFAAPGALAVLPNGTLYIADSGNNRLLSDVRSNIAFNFGKLNEGSSSPTQNFTETNIGPSPASLPNPLFTQSPVDSQLTLVAAANSNGSIPACAAAATFAPGASCNLQGQFSPTDLVAHSDAYTQPNTGISTSAPVPSITLIGQAATLTLTTGVVSQTTPATGNAQFGGPLTLTTTITPASCNASAPNCYPTGTVTFIVDGTASAPIALTGSGSAATASNSISGLSVGPHTVSCQYSGDDFYAATVCTTATITIATASTTATLTATNSGAPQFPTTSCAAITGGALQKDTQCNTTTLAATVVSTTQGVPTGYVTFYANGTALNPIPSSGAVNINNAGVAQLTLSYTYDPSGNLVANSSLLPGTYKLTCQYSGASNYSATSCPAITYTVTSSRQALTLIPFGCVSSALYQPGTFTANLASACVSGQFTNGIPTVATAEGSTTDATIFIIPSNTVSGTLTFSCSGLPSATSCTFQPTSIPITASTGYNTPVSVDVTFFTDVAPGTVPTSSLKKASGSHQSGVGLSMMIGWPLTFFGLLTMLGLRRKKLRSLSLLASILVLAGSAISFSGCAGPGDYTPTLTPAGTYPVTITVTNGTISATTIVDFKITSPGITGQE